MHFLSTASTAPRTITGLSARRGAGAHPIYEYLDTATQRLRVDPFIRDDFSR